MAALILSVELFPAGTENPVLSNKQKQSDLVLGATAGRG